MTQRRCNKCCGWYDEIFFESQGHLLGMHTSQKYKRAICKGCSQTARDRHKLANRWRAKMRSTRKSHAIKAGILESEFGSAYRWNLDQMEHDARHAYDNGCPLCGETFFLMGHGLADITLDIIVPDSPPVYGVNTRWLCATCNRQKGKYTMKEYGLLTVNWQRWKHQTDNIWIGTLLESFDANDLDMGKASQMEFRRRGDLILDILHNL